MTKKTTVVISKELHQKLRMFVAKNNTKIEPVVEKAIEQYIASDGDGK